MDSTQQSTTPGAAPGQVYGAAEGNPAALAATGGSLHSDSLGIRVGGAASALSSLEAKAKADIAKVEASILARFPKSFMTLAGVVGYFVHSAAAAHLFALIKAVL